MFRAAISIAAALACAPAFAEDLDDGGTLNPEELTVQFFAPNADAGKVDPIGCMHGYFATKVGDHETARRIFGPCVDQGNIASMTMLSQMHDNGQAGPEDPEAAAALDRRAASLGDPVGQYNYGLDLMRGRGVARDEAAGRAMVDLSAAQGFKAAQRLVAADYDLDVATPNADNWKYDPAIW